VELFLGFQDDCWFSTGHFADVMTGFGHDATFCLIMMLSVKVLVFKGFEAEYSQLRIPTC
jgi:hypothetical protein